MQTVMTTPSLTQFILYFLKLGATGFGGPIALVGYMQKDLVEERRWVTKEEYQEGLALAQLAPGPLAAQLAIYLGWVRAGVLGATMVGIAFIVGHSSWCWPCRHSIYGSADCRGCKDCSMASARL